jgi:hypothetical protein
MPDCTRTRCQRPRTITLAKVCLERLRSRTNPPLLHGVLVQKATFLHTLRRYSYSYTHRKRGKRAAANIKSSPSLKTIIITTSNNQQQLSSQPASASINRHQPPSASNKPPYSTITTAIHRPSASLRVSACKPRPARCCIPLCRLFSPQLLSSRRRPRHRLVHMCNSSSKATTPYLHLTAVGRDTPQTHREMYFSPVDFYAPPITGPSAIVSPYSLCSCFYLFLYLHSFWPLAVRPSVSYPSRQGRPASMAISPIIHSRECLRLHETLPPPPHPPPPHWPVSSTSSFLLSLCYQSEAL